MLHEYVAEKLRELDGERLDRALIVRRELEDQNITPRSKPVIGPVIRAAGRTLRRAGEGLEGWASPPPASESEQRLRVERRTG